MLGGKLSGGRNSSKSHGVREWGTFRSRSDSDYTDHAFALRSYKNYAQFHGFYSKNLCPVRRRVKTVS